ncbi:hypothetical protein [Xylanibacter ruminicola]|uniref:hypothetical protein n=1 Tax=Xylanibacter ruminicola TaxID=839 RepID=UPI000945A1B9|nr:hypothetical protein [Xylanibacter ruminicola]
MLAKIQISEHNKIHLFHIFSKIFAKFRYSFYLCAINQKAMEIKSFPIIGPSSEEEAVESIDKFEENLRNGQVHWTSSEEFDRQLFEEFPWLR